MLTHMREKTHTNLILKTIFIYFWLNRLVTCLQVIEMLQRKKKRSEF